MADDDRQARVRMTGTQRRAQLLDVGRSLFAERGYDGTSVEEIASRAGVSKPIVYEHFGGKEGLYAVVVDREVQHLLDSFSTALSGQSPKELLEQACLVLLTYVEEQGDGFQILVQQFTGRGFETTLAGLYSQALVGMVALTGQWWQDHRKPQRDEVAAHLVNLAWNGLSRLATKPTLTRPSGAS